jgi:hypothetical protein
MGVDDSGYKAIAGWRTPIQQHVRDTQSTRIEISRVESGVGELRRGNRHHSRGGGEGILKCIIVRGEATIAKRWETRLMEYGGIGR